MPLLVESLFCRHLFVDIVVMLIDEIDGCSLSPADLVLRLPGDPRRHLLGRSSSPEE